MNIEDVKTLREETGVSVIQCKKALEEADGDMEKAREILKNKSAEMAEKKKEREAGDGLVDSYIHMGGKVGVLLELSCETDFVAKNEDFQKLAHEISLQIASLNPEDVDELTSQDYIKDNEKTIQDLIDEAIGKLGENIYINRFARFEVGEQEAE